MKRLTAIGMVLLLLVCLIGCGQTDDMIAPVSFHYLHTPLTNGEILHGASDSVITAEIRESHGHETDYAHLLDIYLLGPLEPQFRTPYPVGTFLVDFVMDGRNATVILTDNLARLSGIELTLACSCLCLTVMDLTGATIVTILAEDSLLDGKESITMDRSTLILTDNTIPETE